MEENKRNSMIMHGIIILLEIVIIILVITCSGCKCCDETITDTTKIEKEEVEEEDSISSKNYNISLLLDLSDRLEVNSQIEKDTILIGYIEDWFIKNHKSLPQKDLYKNGDRIKVFFYPQPQISNINKYQEDLSVEMTVKSKGKSKVQEIVANRDKLGAMTNIWHNALDKIYTNTINTKGWVGSDIWGFFDKSAKTQCVKKDSRNILIILTDGYLYHKNSWRKEGNKEYTGISPLTIDTQEKILSVNTDLSDLEVLFLELNPKKNTDFARMKQLLTQWCNDMGIKHVEVAQTDLPANTKEVIESFLNND